MKPKLRFPEFTHVWFEATLQDEYDYKNAKAHEPFVVQNGKYKLINSKFISTEGKIFKTVDKVLTKGSVGDVTMVLSDLPNGKALAKAFYIEEDDTYAINQRICRLRVLDEQRNDSKFFYYLINRNCYFLRLDDGISQTHISKGDVLNFRYYTTHLNEQARIKDLLTCVDHKINLLAKKREALEAHKKGLMQKIFSQELRFKREDGADYPEWEYVHLGKIGSFSTSSVDKKTLPNEPIVHLVNYVDVYHHRDINNNTVSQMMTVSAKPTQLKSSNLKKGDILFTPSSETPDDIGHSVVIEEDIINGVYSYHLMRFRPIIEIDIPYSHFFCNHEDVLKQIIRFATGSTRFTVSVGNFEKVVVPLPSIQEQRKIAAVLKSVEGLIDELEKQLNSTLLLKKGLLQQMFV